jgi:hypothetical protein
VTTIWGGAVTLFVLSFDSWGVVKTYLEDDAPTSAHASTPANAPTPADASTPVDAPTSAGAFWDLIAYFIIII